MNKIEIKSYKCELLRDAYISVENKRNYILKVEESYQVPVKDKETGEDILNEDGTPKMRWKWDLRERTPEELKAYFAENPDEEEKLEILEEMLEKLEKLA